MVRIQKIVFAVIAAAIMLAGFAQPTYAVEGNKYWGANYFPQVELTDQYGKKHKFYDDLLKNKMVVINFIYTFCPDSCPLETAKLVQVQKILGDRVGKDVFFYSISIDPKRDTPKELKEYADKFQVKPGWLFLTGDIKDINLIRSKLGQTVRPFEDQLTGHSTSLTIGNEANGQWFQDSSMDDPRYIATIVGDWVSEWSNHKERENSYANVQNVTAADYDRGFYTFKTRCSACHTVGEGAGIGPDLLGVTVVRRHDWLTNFIMNPDKVLASNDPIAHNLFRKYKKISMPNLRLEAKDVNAVIEYIDRQTKEWDAKKAASLGASKSTGGR